MSADTLTFGQRNVGSSTEASVTVSNCGDAALTSVNENAASARIRRRMLPIGSIRNA